MILEAVITAKYFATVFAINSLTGQMTVFNVAFET
jgi:hypothetical protein